MGKQSFNWSPLHDSRGQFIRATLRDGDGLLAYTVAPVVGGFAVYKGRALKRNRVNGSYIYATHRFAMADAEYHYSFPF